MTTEEITEVEQRSLDFEKITTDPKTQLIQAIEAILFVANEPVEIRALAQALETSSKEVAGSVDLLTRDLRQSARGIRIQSGPDGITLVSAPEQSKHVEHFMGLAAHRAMILRKNGWFFTSSAPPLRLPSRSICSDANSPLITSALCGPIFLGYGTSPLTMVL